jgi:hypothetical protein
MKIAQLAYGLTVMIWVLGCARAPEASAPAASATSPASSNYAAPPAAEAAPIAPASPAPAAAPQGLDDESRSRKGAALDQEFATLEAAERALNQAKADLDRLALAEPAKELGRSAASGGASEKKDRAAEPPKASAAGSTAPSALCENACRAFSSLTRAANAVCRLDGNGGSHCTHAKRVLADSQVRVASCSCSVAD